MQQPKAGKAEYWQRGMDAGQARMWAMGRILFHLLTLLAVGTAVGSVYFGWQWAVASAAMSLVVAANAAGVVASRFDKALLWLALLVRAVEKERTPEVEEAWRRLMEETPEHWVN